MSFSSEPLEWTNIFDRTLACLLPLAILFLGYKFSTPLSWDELRSLLLGTPKSSIPPYFSLERAYQAYTQYTRLSADELYNMRRSYSTLGRAHKRLGTKIGYSEKLDRRKYITDLNATITDGIAELALQEFENLAECSSMVNGSDLGRVRESLKHFVRDWSEEGAHERARIFQPILDVLGQIEPDSRQEKKVLVPGSGLGRLAWEISELGFDTTANELSYVMTLAFRFLLSPENTSSINQHILRPYGHWFSHQRSNDSLFRSIPFPDAIPRLRSNFHLIEGDFLTLTAPVDVDSRDHTKFWSKNSSILSTGGYDYIVTLFFIDTSTNVFKTIEHIFHLLRPGGKWINLGPLLWTSGGQANLELSLEEMMQAADEIGFVVEPRGNEVESMRTVECEYTADRNAMMRWVYKAEFWVARKSK